MEEDVKVLVCRLCFNIVPDKNFYLIKGSLRDMLRVLTTEVVMKQNLERTSNPVMCGECYKLLQETFIFKTNFFETEETIEANLPAKYNGKLDLIDIMSKRTTRKRKTNMRTKQLCRTCLKAINNRKFVSLTDTDMNTSLTSLLSCCIPEMDLKLTKDPVICRLCYNTLQKMQSFKNLCNTNESKMDSFLRTINTDTCKVNLHEVIQFSKNRVPVKTEPNEEGTEFASEKGLRIADCLECVLVKMEPFEGINLRRRNRLNKSQSTTSKQQHRSKEIGMTYCSDCNFKTKYKYNLRRHLIMAHKRKDIEVNKKSYHCVHCSFSTKWNIDLTRHLLSHVKPEALKCTRCPFSTDQNSQLIKHILSHVNAENMDKYKFLQLP